MKQEYLTTIKQVIDNIEKVIVGKRETIIFLLVGLLSDGHVLLEDVPGVGKTMLARALAITFTGDFKRIQFTPDLLPSDITGVSVYNLKTQEFEFHNGPIFTNFLLADEINRTSPKTQAALLEAMEERQVTVDGKTKVLPRPFFIIATQNPIEYEGTFPLPEAQLDRFLLKLKIGYPTYTEEIKILDMLQMQHPIETIAAKATLEQLQELKQVIKTIHIDESLKQYIVQLVQNTRKHENIYLGASPRASLNLMRTSQALAFIRGRDFIVPDDVKNMAQLVLGHRIILSSEARLRGTKVEDVISNILRDTPVPFSPSNKRL